MISKAKDVYNMVVHQKTRFYNVTEKSSTSRNKKLESTNVDLSFRFN